MIPFSNVHGIEGSVLARLNTILVWAAKDLNKVDKKIASWFNQMTFGYPTYSVAQYSTNDNQYRWVYYFPEQLHFENLYGVSGMQNRNTS